MFGSRKCQTQCTPQQSVFIFHIINNNLVWSCSFFIILNGLENDLNGLALWILRLYKWLRFLCLENHMLMFGKGILPILSHSLGWKKWFENGLKKKLCWMIWLCEFPSGINGWDLKILYKNLESWKKRVWKKWNGIEWFVGLENWIVWNSIEWNVMVWNQTWGKFF